MEIRKTSDDTMAYIDQINDLNNTETDHYILYALTYAYNEKDINELSSVEIKKIAESHFNIELKEEDINNTGVTLYLLENQVSHNPEESKYTLNTENLTQSQIAKIPIVKYVVKNVSKSGGNYYVEYEKYIVDNPYAVLDYYHKLTESMSDEERAANSSAESDGIYKYLTAQGKIKDIKAAINSDNIADIGRIEGGAKVTYIVKNDKLLVDKIEKIE